MISLNRFWGAFWWRIWWWCPWSGLSFLGKGGPFNFQNICPMHIGNLVFLSWRYSSHYTVSPSIVVPTNSHNSFNGKFIEERFIGVACAVVVSIQASITSCVNVLVVCPLECMLFSGVLFSSWVMYFGLCGQVWLSPIFMVVVTLTHFALFFWHHSCLLLGLCLI